MKMKHRFKFTQKGILPYLNVNFPLSVQIQVFLSLASHRLQDILPCSKKKVASINAHVFPPSDSQSASETLSWEPVQSVEKPSIALVVTSNTLQNAASMPSSFKGGKISNKQPPRQQLQSVHTVT